MLRDSQLHQTKSSWTHQPSGQREFFPIGQQRIHEYSCCKHNYAGALQSKFPTQDIVVGPEVFPARVGSGSCQNHESSVGLPALQSCGTGCGCCFKHGVPAFRVCETCKCKQIIPSFAASMPKSEGTCCCERRNTVSMQLFNTDAQKSGALPSRKVGKLLNPALASRSGETFCHPGVHKAAPDQHSYPAIAQASRASCQGAVLQDLQHTIAQQEPSGSCCCDKDDGQKNMTCSACARGPCASCCYGEHNTIPAHQQKTADCSCTATEHSTECFRTHDAFKYCCGIHKTVCIGQMTCTSENMLTSQQEKEAVPCSPMHGEHTEPCKVCSTPAQRILDSAEPPSHHHAFCCLHPIALKSRAMNCEVAAYHAISSSCPGTCMLFVGCMPVSCIHCHVPGSPCSMTNPFKCVQLGPDEVSLCHCNYPYKCQYAARFSNSVECCSDICRNSKKAAATAEGKAESRNTNVNHQRGLPALHLQEKPVIIQEEIFIADDHQCTEDICERDFLECVLKCAQAVACSSLESTPSSSVASSTIASQISSTERCTSAIMALPESGETSGLESTACKESSTASTKSTEVEYAVSTASTGLSLSEASSTQMSHAAATSLESGTALLLSEASSTQVDHAAAGSESTASTALLLSQESSTQVDHAAAGLESTASTALLLSEESLTQAEAGSASMRDACMEGMTPQSEHQAQIALLCIKMISLFTNTSIQSQNT